MTMFGLAFVLEISGDRPPPWVFVAILLTVAGGTIPFWTRIGTGYKRERSLRLKGLEFILAGKPIKAERCLRKALSRDSGHPSTERVRLLVTLGDALMDQGRFDESKRCLDEALEIGDPTGSGQISMAELFLLQLTSPEKAIEMSDLGVELSMRRSERLQRPSQYERVLNSLRRACGWARTSLALSHLERRSEAQQTLEMAVSLVVLANSEKLRAEQNDAQTMFVVDYGLRIFMDLLTADAHWSIAKALLEMKDTERAQKHLWAVRRHDPKGKLRSLAKKQLETLLIQR